MLKHGEVNPLNVHGLRRLEHCPPHFTTVNFDLRVREKHVSDWIYENLESRFWFGTNYYSTETGSTAVNQCVAFEIPEEASYFILMLDQINHDKSNMLVF
tara:strand:- start:1552 stop:1851 length:300 start_codon:yes stop_codon:yes gene_type:complete